MFRFSQNDVQLALGNPHYATECNDTSIDLPPRKLIPAKMSSNEFVFHFMLNDFQSEMNMMND